MKQDNKKFKSGQPIIVQLISLIPNEVFVRAVAEYPYGHGCLELELR